MHNVFIENTQASVITMKTLGISKTKVQRNSIINSNSIIFTPLISIYNLFQPICTKLINFSKLALYYFGVMTVVVFTFCLFMALFIRALDIQAEEQVTIVEQHQQYLEIKLPHDAPKGE